MNRILRALAPLALALSAFTAAPAGASDLSDRLEALARNGNGEALFYLGFVHEQGLEGAAADPAAALGFFQRAAAAGEPLSAHLLGTFHAEGSHGLQRDFERARRYWLIAAEAGFDVAQYQVATTYHEDGDLDAAIRWYEAAAHQGDRRALGKLFDIMGPRGARPDAVRAFVYLEINWPAMAREVAQYRNVGGGPSPIDLMRRERRAIERAVPGAERDRARRLVAEWRVALTPVTIRARLGFEGARLLAQTAG